MIFDTIASAVIWFAFLFIWMPHKIIRHRKRIKVSRSKAKAYRFSENYLELKRITRQTQ